MPYEALLVLARDGRLVGISSRSDSACTRDDRQRRRRSSAIGIGSSPSAVEHQVIRPRAARAGPPASAEFVAVLPVTASEDSTSGYGCVCTAR
jgi:hypothetical protein